MVNLDNYSLLFSQRYDKIPLQNYLSPYYWPDDLHAVLGINVPARIVTRMLVNTDRVRVTTSPMYKNRMAHRNGIAFTITFTDTAHLMTRFHQPIAGQSYFHPLTSSSWFVFSLAVIMMLLVMHIGNELVMGKIDISNMLPLLFMFHYEEISYMMKKQLTGIF